MSADPTPLTTPNSARANTPIAAASTSEGRPGDVSRHVGPYASRTHHRRYYVILGGLIVAALALTVLLLTWGNSYPLLSEKWWRISGMRVDSLVVIALVTFCHSFGTVAFQTVTNNRIITPSIMGFESLYVLIQTSIVYFFGTTGLVELSGLTQFLMQTSMMVLFAVLLYSWLFSGKLGNLHIMLLVGIILGTGLGALSAFMQRMLNPNEFDVLLARLFGNIGNANTSYLPIVIPICAATGIAIWLLARRLNVLSLGAEISTNLGMNHRRQVMLMLTLVTILMAMSTSLVGPMTFLGFLVATLAYSLTDTYDHRLIFPIAWLLGYVILGGAYFLLRHVLPMVDAVTIIVELIGGLAFLIVILKRGRL
ncbi:iron chelate uptake ABC transporter family permease subunit [Leucobacter sp. UT-8R-CII-1-4]|uniref:iron chelate uptake ABC transporter family permease subunit n=1 Tax=Leucobacter sp. UT-8R-CII-1-4 TaxID=3040075 RepID=UPI0024A9EDBA|nr:iron chelate uptake ABC transporter family permease subunit [Leucobacter sp. UT-8R-CII-1-4]MDI6022152.1 iron chelate uptake ABC transporter family permease subunit [Leucobacter sp. UT-8R-CII-1-4]